MPMSAPVCCSTSCAREALSFAQQRFVQATQLEMAARYAEYFPDYVKTGIAAELLDPELARFDLGTSGRCALKPERDLQFDYLGLQTLYDRYFLHIRGKRFELPQAFFMRVAMGLAVREIEREAKAIEFYDLLSSFDFMASTPTLFNSGTLPSAAFLLLPHDGAGRSRRHFQIASRTMRCWRNIPAVSATTGRRCVASARISRARMARARASCRS